MTAGNSSPLARPRARLLTAAIALAVLAACSDQTAVSGTQPGQAASMTAATVAANVIRGRVTSANGPEAGVWVIAETRDLPTRFAKIVVTDDDGNYLLPELPDANYEIWVRGYGLVDSARVTSRPGAQLDLVASIAPDAASAAEYYPAGYWYSLLEVPGEDQFPGTGPMGNGISPTMRNQAQFIHQLTNGGCVVCHQLGNAATRNIPDFFNGFDSSAEAWARRVQSGQAGGFMIRTLTSMGLEGTTRMYGDWSDRIPLNMLDENTGPVSGNPVAPSPYWGDEAIWDSRANVHNPMLDAEGRVWITARVRGRDNPDFCRAGSSHPAAQAYPTEASGRQLGMYDPQTGEYHHIDTCFGTHHLMFAEDADNTLWTSGGGAVVGWLNTRQYLETGDAAASQGWTPTILDTNGNGRRDDYVGPNDPPDPERDTQIMASFYAVAPAADGSVWGSVLGFPGGLARLVPGDDPVHTALVEYYQPPVDANGNPLNGPEARGQHCPEGWTFYPEPLPQFRNVSRAGSSEGSYYTWVDQFDTFGLGANTPINTGNQSGALLALNDGEFVRLIVPYPLGFYAKWLDGRIDDPAAGWKGRGLWATYSSRAPFHMETGKGQSPIVYHFQLRPDPLAE